ncbi:hypothetical protein [Streptomyces noursei]
MDSKDALTLFNTLLTAAVALLSFFGGATWGERRKAQSAAQVNRHEKLHGDAGTTTKAVVRASRELQDAVESAYRTEDADGVERALRALANTCDEALTTAPAAAVALISRVYVTAQHACTVVFQQGKRWHASAALAHLVEEETDIRGVCEGPATRVRDLLAQVRLAAQVDGAAVVGDAIYRRTAEQLKALTQRTTAVGAGGVIVEARSLEVGAARALLRDASSPDAGTVQGERDLSVLRLAAARNDLMRAIRDHNGIENA